MYPNAEKILSDIPNYTNIQPLVLINFADAEPVSLNDVYRRFSLSHFYPDFTRFMVDKGSIDRHSRNQQIKPASDW